MYIGNAAEESAAFVVVCLAFLDEYGRAVTRHCLLQNQANSSCKLWKGLKIY